MPKRKSSAQGIPPPASRRLCIPTQHTNNSSQTDEPLSENLPNEIADLVHTFFEYLTTSKGHGGGGLTAARPGSGQWTVVAGFVVLRDLVESRKDTTENEGDWRLPHSAVDNTVSEGRTEIGGRWVDMTLISIASGVKCLGGAFPLNVAPIRMTPNSTGQHEKPPSSAVTVQGGRWSERDALVVDMHAEVLARREVECLLLWEMRVLVARFLRGASMTGDNDEIEIDGTEPILLELIVSSPETINNSTQGEGETQKPYFRMKKGINLMLYTSHAPCGAASDAAHVRRLDAEDTLIREMLAGLNMSVGTIAHEIEKSGNHYQQAPPSTRAEQAISAFRRGKSHGIPPVVKKPSRADAPPTEAYSCTDKLSRAQWLGFQGGRLARFMEAPVRMRELVVGEDFEEECLERIFGRSGERYSRVREVVAVLEGRDGGGRAWLEGLIQDEPCQILQTGRRFRYGREAATQGQATPRIPADVDLEEIRHMPLPLLRDVLLLPSTGPVPFPVALAWHAYSIPQALGPNGRLSGVTRDKKTKLYGENSVARVARGRMWDAFEDFLGDYKVAFGSLGDERRKGGPGWRDACEWMEERGPFARWHARL